MMSEDMQLVLLGGGLALLGSILGTILASLLQHHLEGRRKLIELRVDLLRAMGKNTILTGGEAGLDEESTMRLLDAAERRAKEARTLERLAIEVGFMEATGDVLDHLAKHKITSDKPT